MIQTKDNPKETNDFLITGINSANNIIFQFEKLIE